MAQQQYTQYQQPLGQQYAPPQGKSDLPLIVGAIVVTIIVIIGAVLFVVFTSGDENKKSDGNGSSTTAPTGALDFTDQGGGNYIGGIVSLSDDLKLSDCSITIIDVSDGSSAAQGPPLRSGIPITTSGGLSLKYSDTNSNSEMDAGDVWIISNGADGDQIKLIYKTGKQIALYTIQ